MYLLNLGFQNRQYSQRRNRLDPLVSYTSIFDQYLHLFDLSIVGFVDWNVRDFHGYQTERGSTYNAYLIQDEKTAPLIGDPIGREALLDALAREFVPYSPEELLAMAEKELAWCEAEGAKAQAAANKQ